MKIELKNVKYSAFASEETSCFQATVYVDGVKAGTAENGGKGGGTMIFPHALEARLNEHAKTLPEVVSSLGDPNDRTQQFTYAQTAESLIDDLLCTHLQTKDLQRAMGRKVLFLRGGSIYETRTMPKAQIEVFLADPAKATAQLKAEKILNLLPFDEAFAIYTAPKAHAEETAAA